jgi:uncharacterized membrane protein YtjA (UPF0391 family)
MSNAATMIGTHRRAGRRCPTGAGRLSDARARANFLTLKQGGNPQRGCVKARLNQTFNPGRIIMLKLAIIFAVVSLIAGLFGFSGIAAGAAGIAKVLFFICITIFVVLLALALFGISLFSS